MYWSHRLGRGPRANPSIDDVARVLTLAVTEMSQRDFFQEWYGYDCVDAGVVEGKARVDIATHAETVLGYREAWPLPDPLLQLPDGPVDDLTIRLETERMEDRVFDLIEFFHDHVSEGIEVPAAYHDYSDCGWHFREFRPEPAQTLFRTRLNAVLGNYRSGFRLTAAGEIERTAPAGLDDLVDTPLRTTDLVVKGRVDEAIATYRNRHRSEADQRDAVRNLFDVLEKLRPIVKTEMLRGDERDLFNIANNFTVRHLNESQKGNYDRPLWFSWMFYVNLATIHVLTRLEARTQASDPTSRQ